MDRYGTGQCDMGRYDTGRYDTGRYDTGRYDTGRSNKDSKYKGQSDKGPKHKGPKCMDQYCKGPAHMDQGCKDPDYRDLGRTDPERMDRAGMAFAYTVQRYKYPLNNDCHDKDRWCNSWKRRCLLDTDRKNTGLACNDRLCRALRSLARRQTRPRRLPG